jgi:hypothetical protein
MRKVFMTAIAVAGGVAIWMSVPATAGASSIRRHSSRTPRRAPSAVLTAHGRSVRQRSTPVTSMSRSRISISPAARSTRRSRMFAKGSAGTSTGGSSSGSSARTQKGRGASHRPAEN